MMAAPNVNIYECNPLIDTTGGSEIVAVYNNTDFNLITVDFGLSWANPLGINTFPAYPGDVIVGEHVGNTTQQIEFIFEENASFQAELVINSTVVDTIINYGCTGIYTFTAPVITSTDRVDIIFTNPPTP